MSKIARVISLITYECTGCGAVARIPQSEWRRYSEQSLLPMVCDSENWFFNGAYVEHRCTKEAENEVTE